MPSSTQRRRAGQARAQKEAVVDELRSGNRHAGDTNVLVESRELKQPKALMAAKKAAYQRKKMK